MAKEVVGIYTTLQETIDVVDRLTAQGYSTSNISIISNGNDGTLLKKQTGANVDHTTTVQDEQNSSVWEKIKGFFKPDYYDETTRKLTNLDLPQDELDRYSTEIDAGHYLVLVDNDASALNETAAPRTADPATEVSGQTTASGLKNEFGENYSTSQEKKVDVREKVLDVEKNPCI